MRLPGHHLCERLVDQGHDVICVDNFFTSQKSNVAHLLSAQFRTGAARRHASALAGSRRDLQPGLPRRAGPLPVQPHQDDEDVRDGAINMLGMAKRAGPRSCRPRPARSTATRRSIRSPKVTAERQSDRAPGLLRRRKAGGRDVVHGLSPHEQGECPAGADLQHLRPADASVRRPRGVELHPPGAAGEDITIFGDGSQTRPSAIATT